MLRGDSMKEKNFQKYPKWLKDNKYVERAMEKFANHKARVVLNNERLFMIDWQWENRNRDRTVRRNEGEQKGMNRDDASKFQVGDRVYAPFHGYGTVIKVHEHPSVYPVVVKWDNSATSLVEEVNLFTEDGYLSRWTKTDDTRISVAREPLKEGEEMKDVIPPKKDKKEGKFKVGDRVYFPYFGLGTVTEICDRGGYPVEVTWDSGYVTSFTPEGFLDYADNNDKLTLVKKRDKGMEKCTDERRKIMDYQKIARGIVLNYVNKYLDKTDNVHITSDDVYLVWFCKVLQNWKALVSTNLPDGMYYEVTYNGDKKEVYLDAYKKFDNREIDESQIKA